MHAKMTWPKLIEAANALAGFEQYKYNRVIYKMNNLRYDYFVLFNTSQITKKHFIDYVQSDLADDCYNEDELKNVD